jgi:hypothetical protein
MALTCVRLAMKCNAGNPPTRDWPEFSGERYPLFVYNHGFQNGWYASMVFRWRMRCSQGKCLTVFLRTKRHVALKSIPLPCAIPYPWDSRCLEPAWLGHSTCRWDSSWNTWVQPAKDAATSGIRYGQGFCGKISPHVSGQAI